MLKYTLPAKVYFLLAPGSHLLLSHDVLEHLRIVEELPRLHAEDLVKLEDVVITHPPDDHQPAVLGEDVGGRSCVVIDSIKEPRVA